MSWATAACNPYLPKKYEILNQWFTIIQKIKNPKKSSKEPKKLSKKSSKKIKNPKKFQKS